MSESVWVIETGSYSDYRVLGVFSTEAKALAMAEAAGIDAHSVSEWDLDPGIDNVNAGRVRWLVHMSPTGDVKTVRRETTSESIEDWLNVQRHGVFGIVWATDETHAIKIVNEHRIQARARGEL